MFVGKIKKEIVQAAEELLEDGILVGLLKRVSETLVDGTELTYNLETKEVTIKKSIIKKEF
jgi:hypothetical protein